MPATHLSHPVMNASELAAMLDEAAERGANRVLEKLGLTDEDAGKDIRDLRTLIDGWRKAKRSALQAMVQWVTTAVLGILAAAFYLKFGGK